MWTYGSPSMWLMAVLKYSCWKAVLKDSFSCVMPWSCGLIGVALALEVRGCVFKSDREQCLSLVWEERTIYYNYIYSRRDSFSESTNTFDHLLVSEISNSYSKFMFHNLKTLLLRNDQTFKKWSNFFIRVK